MVDVEWQDRRAAYDQTVEAYETEIADTITALRSDIDGYKNKQSTMFGYREGSETALETLKKYENLLNELWEIHEKKAHDYGSEEDPLFNLRAAVQFGVPASTATLIRMNDKMHRLMRFASGHNLVNESARDSLIDLANYSLLCVVLLDEEAAAAARKVPTGTYTLHE